MTGRLNPRRYDLGELRDAVREPPRRRGVDDTARGFHGDGSDSNGERTIPVEPTTDSFRFDGESTQRSEWQYPGTDSQNDAEHAIDTSASEQTDEVESYLRSRHRHRNGERTTAAAGSHESARESGRPGEERKSDTRRTAAPTELLAELSGPDVSKPYLDRLPDAYAAQLEVFEWLEGLLATAGRENTRDAIEYYESIGWLSERSRDELENVVAGLRAPDSAERQLGTDDHRESLIYVARLARRRRG